MNPDRAASPRFRRKTLWLTLLALMAVGVFWGVRQNRQIVAERFVPLIVAPPPAGMIVSSPVPNGVEIRLKGPRRTIEALDAADLACRVDPKGAGTGTLPVTLDAEHLTLPPGVSLMNIEPSQVVLKIDRRGRRKVPVTVVFSGQPAAGHSVGEAGAEPASVLLSGPAPRLAPLDQIPTATLDITGATETVEKPLPVDLPEGVTRVSGEKTVIARIQIVETVASRSFAAVPITVRNAAHAVRVTPPVIDIEVEGPVNLLDGLEPDRGIDIHVDLGGLKPGVYVRRAVIDLPVKITLRSASPELFTVTILPGAKGASGKKSAGK